MKTQDKIYVHEISAGELTENLPYHVCYLRKDTLLDWVKEQKAWLKQGYKKDWKNDDTLNGGRLMLDRLINKLNSM